MARAFAHVAALLAVVTTSAAQAQTASQIVAAEYDGETTAYPHGALGDDIEYTALRITLEDGTSTLFQLPQDPLTRVFEDLSPRLADVDGDGDAEVIVVESDFRLGAQLAIYDETGKIASTPHIGRRFRWLAPVGAADLDGDGIVEVAFIDRPHLAKSLTIYKFQDGKLAYLRKFDGLTNHRNGSDTILGGIRDCGDGPEIVTANGNWSRVVISRLTGDRIQAKSVSDYKGPASIEAAMTCN